MTQINLLRQKTSLCLLVIYVRYLIGGAYVFSGIGKAMGERFIQAGSMQIPPMGMTLDVFFETLYRTGLWWQFLGWGQLVSGFLLLTQRWSTLGAVAFLPISINIFLITLSMDFHGTPLITGLMVLANLGLLGWDSSKLSPLLQPNQDTTVSIHWRGDQLGHPRYWAGLGLVIFLTSISFGNRVNPPLWLLVCLVEGLIGWLGWWFFRRGKPNDERL
ncbi:hypothetical protein [Spirosoma fluviale]|uniref:DoxX protein n=1 Tax=Spirosoma fluviale TaxID=1597977 RepID=A0A286GAY5_9BACT|nr:hypothetical protein [Spirosoma fluviale]SOD92174.1 hypothetical protein SAMN06269250_3840 [Spirosoma fluviale]